MVQALMDSKEYKKWEWDRSITLNIKSEQKEFSDIQNTLFVRFLSNLSILKIYNKEFLKSKSFCPSLSIVFGLSSKTQWLSGLYYADFISFYSPTQLCGGGTTKSNSNEWPISVPLSFFKNLAKQKLPNTWLRSYSILRTNLSVCPRHRWPFRFLKPALLLVQGSHRGCLKQFTWFVL